MSSNRMPLVGKSGNWRRDWWSLILRLANSAAEEVEEAASPFWGAREASGLSRGGCEEVESVMAKGGREGGRRRSGRQVGIRCSGLCAL